jgi:hypothetical protein
MASWQISFGPGTKAAVNTAIGAATIAQLTGLDPGVPLNGSDATLSAHLAAAKTAAQGALAALTGSALKATVTIQGYRDSVAAGVAPAGMVASKITITAEEVW